MPAEAPARIEVAVRAELTRDRLHALMEELARTAPHRGHYRVYLVGGATAVHAGWRPSSIDADLFSDQEEVFHDIQGIKERLNVNVDFARPEHFVPALTTGKLTWRREPLPPPAREWRASHSRPGGHR